MRSRWWRCRVRPVGPTVAVVGILALAGGGGLEAQRAPTPLRAEVEEAFVVRGGPPDGRGVPQEFGRVTDVAFASDGAVWVLDGLSYRVTRVGADGRPARSFGRAGDGPGEFRRPFAITAPSATRVAVLDTRRGRVMMFDTLGVLVHDWPTPEELGDGALTHTGPETLVLVGGASRWQQPDSITVWTLRVGRDPRFTSSARVANPRRASEMSEPGAGADGGVRFQRRSLAPFLPAVRSAGGARLALVPTFAYEIRVFDADRPRVVRQAVEVRAVDERLRNRARDELRRSMLERAGGEGTSSGGFASLAMSPADIDAWAESMLFPERVPVVRDLAATPEGGLWVLVTDGDDLLHPRRVDVYGPDLELEGTLDALAFPAALGPGGLAAWVERDAFDAEFVRVGRVRLWPAG